MGKKKEIKQGEHVRDYVRSSFWLIIGLWVIYGIFPNFEIWGGFDVLLWVGGSIFCFVNSIRHLTMFKEKGFAITSLVVSSYLILSFTIGFLIGAATY